MMNYSSQLNSLWQFVISNPSLSLSPAPLFVVCSHTILVQRPIDQRSSQTRFCSFSLEHWNTTFKKMNIQHHNHACWSPTSSTWKRQSCFSFLDKLGPSSNTVEFNTTTMFLKVISVMYERACFLLFCTNFDLAVFNVCCSCGKVGGGVSCKMPLLWLRLPHFYLQTCNWSKHWSSPIKLVLSNPRLGAETFGSVGDTFHTKLEKKIQFWAENLDFSGNGGAWQLLLGYFKVCFLTRWSFA